MTLPSLAWTQPQALPTLLEGNIHIWRLLPAWRLPHEAYLPSLRKEEVLRAARFVYGGDGLQSVATRATLRRLAAHYTGTTALQELEIAAEKHGKPTLKTSRLCFNLSHTHDTAVFAFAWGRALGIDIEQVRAMPDLNEIAHQNFSSEEYQALQGLRAEDRIAGFFRCWTRKEALLKAEGSGLLRNLDGFTVTVGPQEPTRVLTKPWSAEWSLAHLDVRPDIIGAVAWRRISPPPRFMLFDALPSLLFP